MTTEKQQHIDEILTYMIDVIIARKSNYLSLESWYHDDKLCIEWGDTTYEFHLNGYYTTRDKYYITRDKRRHGDKLSRRLSLGLQTKVLHIYLKINGETENYLRNYTLLVKKIREKKLKILFRD